MKIAAEPVCASLPCLALTLKLVTTPEFYPHIVSVQTVFIDVELHHNGQSTDNQQCAGLWFFFFFSSEVGFDVTREQAMVWLVSIVCQVSGELRNV